MQIDATIKSAWKEKWGEHTIILGQIYGDKKSRFPDGKFIHTSYVVEELPDGVFKTRNSVYKVEWRPK